jgi:hypothetical protein
MTTEGQKIAKQSQFPWPEADELSERLRRKNRTGANLADWIRANGEEPGLLSVPPLQGESLDLVRLVVELESE